MNCEEIENLISKWEQLNDGLTLANLQDQDYKYEHTPDKELPCFNKQNHEYYQTQKGNINIILQDLNKLQSSIAIYEAERNKYEQL